MYLYFEVELQGNNNVFNVQTWGINCEQCMNYIACDILRLKLHWV